MKFKNLFFNTCLSVLIISLASCRDSDQRDADDMGRDAEVIEEDLRELQDTNGDLVTTVEGDPELSTFASRLNAADIAGSLEDGREYTIFAPSNYAYSLVSQEQDGTDMLHLDYQDIVLYHITESEYTMDDLRNRLRNAGDSLNINTMHDENIQVMMEDGELTLKGSGGNTAKITGTLESSNGIVHIISGVLIPIQFDKTVELTTQ